MQELAESLSHHQLMQNAAQNAHNTLTQNKSSVNLVEKILLNTKLRRQCLVTSGAKPFSGVFSVCATCLYTYNSKLTFKAHIARKMLLLFGTVIHCTKLGE